MNGGALCCERRHGEESDTLPRVETTNCGSFRCSDTRAHARARIEFRRRNVSVALSLEANTLVAATG